MSITGGLHHAFERIGRVGGEALQIFTRNQRQWRAQPLTDEEVRFFRDAWEKQGGMMPVAAHNSYLVNLASPEGDLEAKSIQAMVQEMRRAGRLHIPFVIIHPGAHKGDGVEEGIVRIAANVDRVFDAVPEYGGVMILLETTAGQGTSIGSRFEELADIMAKSRHAGRLGVCFDTAHVFAAGYDIRAKSAYASTMAAFDRIIGIERLRFFHLNDSKGECGSRLDRHEHIGKGMIGLGGFRHLLNDPRFARHPMTLETPKGEDLREDRENLCRLRRLLKKKPI